MVEMKRCTRCKEEKEANNDNFCKNNNSDDGLFSWCKDCQKENRIKRRKTLKHYVSNDVIDENELLSTKEVDDSIKKAIDKDKRFKQFWENEIKIAQGA